jgi:hypothetical protein
MNTSTRQLGTGDHSVIAGNVTLVLGALFSVAVAITYVLSLSDVVDPPNWIRAIALAWLPIGLGGVPISYAFARVGPGRERGRVGVAVALVGLVAFIALVVALG